MSSQFEGLEDSWQERQQRNQRANKRRRAAIYRVAVVTVAISVGAGLGACVETWDFDDALKRLGGALFIGLATAWSFFGFFIRLAVKADMSGQNSGMEDDWLLAGAPVCGALFGSPIGAVLLVAMNRQAGFAGYIGAQVAAGLVAVAAGLYWWFFIRAG